MPDQTSTFISSSSNQYTGEHKMNKQTIAKAIFCLFILFSPLYILLTGDRVSFISSVSIATKTSFVIRWNVDLCYPKRTTCKMAPLHISCKISAIFVVVEDTAKLFAGRRSINIPKSSDYGQKCYNSVLCVLRNLVRGMQLQCRL